MKTLDVNEATRAAHTTDFYIESYCSDLPRAYQLYFPQTTSVVRLREAEIQIRAMFEDDVRRYQNHPFVKSGESCGPFADWSGVDAFAFAMSHRPTKVAGVDQAIRPGGPIMPDWIDARSDVRFHDHPDVKAAIERAKASLESPAK